MLEDLEATDGDAFEEDLHADDFLTVEVAVEDAVHDFLEHWIRGRPDAGPIRGGVRRGLSCGGPGGWRSALEIWEKVLRTNRQGVDCGLRESVLADGRDRHFHDEQRRARMTMDVVALASEQHRNVGLRNT